MVKLIAEADDEIFNSNYEGVLSERVLQTMDQVIRLTASMIKEHGGGAGVVLSGCGTSGRLAFLLAKSFNDALRSLGREEIFDYLMAGTDKALFVSQELTEDDPATGRLDLEKATRGKTRVLYVGITCGLSAPYVAGQLDYCMDNLDLYIPVLVGFNPVSQARNVAVDNWNKTFLQVAKRLVSLEADNLGFILNPIIGPEPITGSSRMKGGTATKVLLASLFTSVLSLLLSADSQSATPVRELLQSFREVAQTSYSHGSGLTTLIEFGGRSLKSGGHIYYLSAEQVGVMGLIDASECTPTYGCHMDDVRGFISGGYKTLGNKEGNMADHRPISLEYFGKHILPSLTNVDLIVFIVKDNSGWITAQLLATPSVKYILEISETECRSGMPYSVNWAERLDVHARLPPSLPLGLEAHFRALLCALAVKVVCNLLTTGAHVLNGKVYENYMIDMQVSNNKLFHRAVSIVQRFGECGSEEKARQSLLRALHESDSLNEDQIATPISQLISLGTGRHQIVPMAILVARLRCSVHEAKAILASCPVVRTALSNQKGRATSHVAID